MTTDLHVKKKGGHCCLDPLCLDNPRAAVPPGEYPDDTPGLLSPARLSELREVSEFLQVQDTIQLADPVALD